MGHCSIESPLFMTAGCPEIALHMLAVFRAPFVFFLGLATVFASRRTWQFEPILHNAAKCKDDCYVTQRIKNFRDDRTFDWGAVTAINQSISVKNSRALVHDCAANSFAFSRSANF
jgi:hypothetical protein